MQFLNIMHIQHVRLADGNNLRVWILHAVVNQWSVNPAPQYLHDLPKYLIRINFLIGVYLFLCPSQVSFFL
jgi:hypothetical protein